MSNIKPVLALGAAIVLVPLVIFAKTTFSDFSSKKENRGIQQANISKDWSADQIQGLLNCQK